MECDHLDHYSPDRGLLVVRYILGIDEQEAQQHGSNDTPEQKELLQLPSSEINRVLDGDTIDVTIDLGFDLYKKERVRVAGVDTPEKRTRDLEEKELGIHATNWAQRETGRSGGW